MINVKETLCKRLRKNKTLLQIVLVPLLVSFIPIVWRDSIGFCAFSISLMSIYWMLGCMPIAVTSLMPLFLFPLFGIMTSRDVSPVYFHDNVMFIFASVMIGLCIEISNLHQKIALKVFMVIGSELKWITFGIIFTAAFISVWISNAATTSMMLPIVISLAKNIIKLDPTFGETSQMVELTESVQSSTVELTEEKSKNSPTTTNEDDDDETIFEKPDAKNMLKCVLLSVLYGSIMGGQSSLIGTSSNVFVKGYFEKYHPNDALNFLTFILYALPITLIQLLIVWILVCLIYLPKGKFITFGAKKRASSNMSAQFHQIVKQKYQELGPHTWEQKSIGVFFLIVVTLWLSRDLYFVPGWNILFKKGYLTDTTSAVLILFFMVAWPKENVFAQGKVYQPLVSWSRMEKMFPWNVVLLVGGSLAMAEGCEISGLSKWLGGILQGILPDSKYLIIMIIMIFGSLCTEFMSNISMVSILLPILDKLAIEKNISYYFLLLPQAVAVNFAYIFPSASPANAIVFGLGFLKLKDLIIFGLINKLIGLIILFAISSTWLEVIFKYEPIINGSTTFSSSTSTLTFLTENFSSTF